MIKEFILGFMSAIALATIVFWVGSCINSRIVKFKYRDQIKVTCGFYKGFKGEIRDKLQVGEVAYQIKSDLAPYTFWVEQSCLDLIDD